MVARATAQCSKGEECGEAEYRTGLWSNPAGRDHWGSEQWPDGPKREEVTSSIERRAASRGNSLPQNVVELWEGHVRTKGTQMWVGRSRKSDGGMALSSSPEQAGDTAKTRPGEGGRSRPLRPHAACERACATVDAVWAKRRLQQSRRELVRWWETDLVLCSAPAQPLSQSPPTLSKSITVTSWEQYPENEVRIFGNGSCIRWKNTMNKGRQRRTLGMQK